LGVSVILSNFLCDCDIHSQRLLLEP